MDSELWHETSAAIGRMARQLQEVLNSLQTLETPQLDQVLKTAQVLALEIADSFRSVSCDNEVTVGSSTIERLDNVATQAALEKQMSPRGVILTDGKNSNLLQDDSRTKSPSSAALVIQLEQRLHQSQQENRTLSLQLKESEQTLANQRRVQEASISVLRNRYQVEIILHKRV